MNGFDNTVNEGGGGEGSVNKGEGICGRKKVYYYFRQIYYEKRYKYVGRMRK